jgi:outer membrane protein assembly factor BamE (lipoprotein component of BamABCDE complex)
MKRLLFLAAAVALAGCGSLRPAEPGMSTAQLESAMGPAADKRVHSDGETWYYYPRQPHGLAMFVARVDREGKVIAVEQRLTDENVARLEKGKSRADDVRDLLGPPWKVWPFPRMQRDIWEYRMQAAAAGNVPQGLYVQISPDAVVREIYLLSDPDNRLSEGGTSPR